MFSGLRECCFCARYVIRFGRRRCLSFLLLMDFLIFLCGISFVFRDVVFLCVVFFGFPERETKSITLIASLSFCFDMIASRKFIPARSSGENFTNPISQNSWRCCYLKFEAKQWYWLWPGFPMLNWVWPVDSLRIFVSVLRLVQVAALRCCFCVLLFRGGCRILRCGEWSSVAWWGFSFGSLFVLDF